MRAFFWFKQPELSVQQTLTAREASCLRDFTTQSGDQNRPVRSDSVRARIPNGLAAVLQNRSLSRGLYTYERLLFAALAAVTWASLAGAAGATPTDGHCIVGVGVGA